MRRIRTEQPREERDERDERDESEEEAPRRRRSRRERRDAEPVVEVKHDTLNEIVVLAAALASPETRAALAKQFPNCDRFGGKNNVRAWAVLLELERRGLQYDPLTAKAIDPELDVEQLEDLCRERPVVPPNLKFHVDALEWDYQRIELAKGPISALVELIRDRSTPREKLMAVTQQIGRFSGESSTSARRFIRSTASLIDEAVRDLEARRAGIIRKPFGIEGLDDYEDGTPRCVHGLEPRRLTTITGISGGGKSTFMKNLLVAQARLERRTTVAAWEDESMPTLRELAVISLGMDRGTVHAGRVDDTDVANIRLEMERMGDFLTFVENPFEASSADTRKRSASNARNLDIIFEMTVETRAEAFFLDLWERGIPEQKPDEVRFALYRQLDIAKATGCHFGIVHQQRSKDIETRDDKRPTREGLMGSAALLDVSTTIFGIHDPAKFKEIKTDKSTLEVLILKQKLGKWPLAVEFQYNPRFGTIWDGRSFDYRHSGESDELIGETMRPSQKKGRKK